METATSSTESQPLAALLAGNWSLVIMKTSRPVFGSGDDQDEGRPNRPALPFGD
jgi:hypothetical protein